MTTKAKKDPRGWIQWKGSTVCIDLWCECGHDDHQDTDFFYYWKCKGCGAVYLVEPDIALTKLTPKEIAGLADHWKDDFK